MSADAPAGTTVVRTIAPMLSVRRGAQAVDFYKSAFGAVEVFRIESPDGAVVSSWEIGHPLPTSHER